MYFRNASLRLALPLALAVALVGAVPASAELAVYRVSFDATWSDATHGPGAFPVDAHFSPLVGSTHDASVSFWSTGALASDGIEAMAEIGATATLDSESQAAITAGDAFAILSGPGIGIAPGTATITSFLVDSDFPLVTLVTMVAPSPDWFVGVSGLPLYQAGQWQDPVVVSLDPYDAGTDSGTAFTSANADTDPPELISVLGAPFTGTPALGTFTFEFLRLATECEDLLDNDGDGFADLGDPGCADASDSSELSDLACDDGIDNDGDMLIDYPEDDGCRDLVDDTETPDEIPEFIPLLPPGGALLLGLALAGLGGWTLRRRERRRCRG